MTDRARALSSAAAATFAAALGFFCCIPYPAVAVGNNTAIQIGNVLTILAIFPILFISWRQRIYWIYPLILAPLVLSAVKVAVSGEGDMGLAFKSIVLWAMSCLALLITQLYAPRYSLELLMGLAAATIVHAAMGLWQMYGFSSGEFPLAELYVNPSFLSVQENARTIARYTQRPFGIFPEPSAMAASLAPWVLFWMAQLCGLIQLRRRPARWQRMMFAIAAAGGLGLMIVSRSGHTAFVIVGVLIFAAAWFIRSRATAASLLAVGAVFGLLLPVIVWFASAAISDRLGGKSDIGNSSWEERSDSLRVGMSLLTRGSISTTVFGLGAGLSAPEIWREARIPAVFSVLLTYVYETGLVGLLVAGSICWHLAQQWKWLRFDLAFAGVAVVWLAGVTLTTSYQQLLPLWMALGWLTVWPAVCRSRGEREVVMVSRREQQEVAPPVARRHAWDRIGSDNGGHTK